MFILRSKEVDGLSQEAANLRYEKFAQSIQSLSGNQLLLSDVYSAFMALHGFVSHYRGYVVRFDEVKEAGHLHAQFIIKALSKEK